MMENIEMVKDNKSSTDHIHKDRDQPSAENLGQGKEVKLVAEEFVASRVTILDAHEIDADLVQILKSQLTQVLKYFPSWVLNKCSAEVDALLRLFLYQQSLLKHQSTFVQNMFQLKYCNVADSPKKTILFAFSNVVSEYVRQKSDEISIYLRGQNKYAYLTYKYVDIALDVLRLANFLVFLNQGRYYTVLERVFKMNLVSRTRAARSIEYTYLSRELLYQSISELLLVLLPLLQSHLILRKLSNWFATKDSSAVVAKKELAVMTSSSKCVICKQFPWQPYHMDCRHVFCYYCLVVSCKLADDRYECCVCSHASDKVHSFASKPVVS